MKPLLISSGEPAGIGPDICIALAEDAYPIVIIGDKSLLEARAAQLKQSVSFVDYRPDETLTFRPGQLYVCSMLCPQTVIPGQLNPANAGYVIDMLDYAAKACLNRSFSALVTAPVHKAVINEAGIPFTGHTEFLANKCGSNKVVMLLCSDHLHVALATTHIPLKDVPDAITETSLSEVIQILHHTFQLDFGVAQPKICVAGLNPHAGESGYLGTEEQDVIKPTLACLKQEGIDAAGPFPADTLFTPDYIKQCDVFLVMYHDQGLPVLKYASFGHAVNITLGLPIIRTSVDHGTALSLAGTGQADAGSLKAAIKKAMKMVEMRSRHDGG